MAFATIFFKNPKTNQTKSSTVGYASDIAWFGPIALLFRDEYKLASIAIGIYAIVTLINPIILLALMLVGHPLIAIYFNKYVINYYIKNGFKAIGITSGDLNYASANIGRDIPFMEE